MKTLGNICKLVAIALMLAALLGCQAKRDVSGEQPGKTAPGETDPRGFDPLELPEDREVVPVTHPKSGDIVGQGAFVESTTDLPDTTGFSPDDLPDEIDTLNSQAFRVQLLTSKVYGDARRALLIAEEIFDRPVYLDYEVPYYKLRVGNFPDREKAEDYLMRAKSAGYSNAWVVAVNIRVQQTTPLYEKPVIPVDEDSLYYEEEETENDQP